MPASYLKHFSVDGVNISLQGIKNHRHFHLRDHDCFSIMLTYGEILIGINARQYLYLVSDELDKQSVKWLCMEFDQSPNVNRRIQEEAKFNYARGLLKIRLAEIISSLPSSTHIQPASMEPSIFDFNPCLIAGQLQG